MLPSLAIAAAEITTNTVEIEVNYEGFVDDTQTTVIASGQFTVNNTGEENLTFRTEVTGLPSASYTVNPIADQTLLAGQSQLIAFTLNVPHEKGSGSAAIGTLTVKDAVSGLVLDQASIIQVTQPMLELTLDVDYTNDKGGSETDGFDKDEEEFILGDEVRPGTEVQLTFEVRNIFDDGYERYGDLEELLLTIDPDDEDVIDGDLDDEYDLDDLEPGEKQKFTVSFMVAEEADESEYTFDLAVEAEDGKKKKHTLERTLKFEVKRQKDDLRLTQLDVSPSRIDACATQFSLDLEVRNLGTNDQDAAAVKVFNEALGIDETVQNLEIEEFDDPDDTWRRVFSFPLDGAAAGTYLLDVRAFYDRDRPTDAESVDVVIEPCVVEEAAASTGREQTQEFPVAGAGNQQESSTEGVGTPPTAAFPIVEITEEAGTNQNLLIAVLVVGIVLVLAVLGLIVAILLK